MTMKTILILLAIVAIATAAIHIDPFAPRSISSTVTNIIEDMRDQMPCGFPDLGIPPLAPLKISHREVDIETPVIQVQGSVDNFRLNGLNNFEVAEMKVNAITSKVTFRFIFNNLNVDTLYDLKVALKKAGFTINLIGNGRARFAINVMEVWGSMRYSFGLVSRKLKLKKLEVRTHIEDAESNIEGILGQGLVNEKLNDILAEGVQIAVNENEQYITDIIQDIIMPALNDILDKHPLTIGGGGGDGGTGGAGSGEKEPCNPKDDEVPQN